MNDIIKMLPDMHRCTGCGACKNICHCDALEMSENIEGFLMPIVDETKCIYCKKCILTCPVLNPKYRNGDMPDAYAIMAGDNIRKISSSGGAFSILANEVLSNGGYVCGVVYDEQFSPKHLVTNNPEVVAGMRGSKYMQSNTGKVYSEIGKILKIGKDVLFTGMPCQVAGLNAYLGIQYENLYTAELLCHGITPFKVFEKYKKDVLKNADLKSLEFKKKEPWGWHAGINAIYEDGTSYQVSAENDPYFKAYLHNISKSLFCGTCIFNCLPRQGDLTIGDFWKVSNFDKALDDDKGTSLILVNNDRGKELFKRVESKWKRCVQAPISYAISGNHSIVAPYKNHFRRNKFYRELSHIPFQRLVEHCAQNTFDVGVLGLWYGINYGSVLTYYALYCVLNQLGYDAIMINKPDYLWVPKFANPQTIANRFINKYCNVSGLHRYEDFPLLNDHCDTFVLGSDIVWNYEISGKSGGNFFFMDFVDDSKRKIAYAASFGGEYDAPAHIEYMNRQYAKAFDAVSVREDSGVALTKKHFGVDADKVLDPVFLCDFSRFDELARLSTKTIDEKYIMTYILGGDNTQRELILSISSNLNCTRLINTVNPNNPSRVQKSLNLDIAEEVDVEDWLNYMKHCHFFIGDSFHGLCFAIIFRRDFLITINSTMPSRDRFLTLLKLCGLGDRIWYKEDDNSERYEILRHKIDYNAVFDRLEKYKQQSTQWLLESLKKEKPNIKPVPSEPPADCSADLFYLAKAVYNNYAGRKIVTWGESKEFNAILKKYFHLEIPFGVTRNDNLVNGDTIRSFSLLRDKHQEYYVVVPEVAHKASDEDIFNEYGYVDIKNFIYRNHKPVVISADEKDDIKREYFDAYSNRISGSTGRKFHIVLHGFNNQIILGQRIRGGKPTVIEMQGFSKLSIGDDCYLNDTRITFLTHIGLPVNSAIIKYGCRFDSAKIVIRDNPCTKLPSELLINNHCTFAHNLKISINGGHKLIIGKDCLFSYNISVQIGDGHAIFDVKSGKRSNILGNLRTNCEILTLGKHVWVGKNSILLSNTNIGSGSIVGAGSLIKGTFPNNCVVAGNPSRVIKTDIAWSRNNTATDIVSCGKENVALTTNAAPPISGRNVLVLGGTRFMGVHLVWELLALGNTVTIATRGQKKDKFGDLVKRILLDRNDEQSVRSALQGSYFDVVFDNTAYCSNYVKYLLDTVRCGKYIQLSSVTVYASPSINMSEDQFNNTSYPLEYCGVDVGYNEGKRQAECAVTQGCKDVFTVAVRIPPVTKTDRLAFFCQHIAKGVPMYINNLSDGLAFIRSEEVGSFLPWIAGQNYRGAINLSSRGFISISMIIDYIERKTGKKAIFSEKGDRQPFIEERYSQNTDICENLGYHVSNIDDWFWPLMDEYIKSAFGQ